MRRKLAAACAVAAVSLGLATPLSTGAAVPVHDNTNDAVACNDLVGQISFSPPLRDGGGTAGVAKWSATSGDCHSPSAGEYDAEGNPDGIALKRATLKGTYPFADNDCTALYGGNGGTLLAGSLTVKFTTRPGTPVLSQRTSTVTYTNHAWSWSYGWGAGTFLELGINFGGGSVPTVTGGFTGEDGGATSFLTAVSSQDYASTLLGDLCATGGVRKITIGLGRFVLG